MSYQETSYESQHSEFISQIHSWEHVRIYLCIHESKGGGDVHLDQPSHGQLAASGGAGTLMVTSRINWTASTNASWITITSGAAGSGNGTVSYSVAAKNSIASPLGRHHHWQCLLHGNSSRETETISGYPSSLRRHEND
jgi:hypothetical protein